MKRSFFIRFLPVTLVMLVLVNGIIRSQVNPKQFYINGITSVKETKVPPEWGPINIIKSVFTSSPIIFDKDSSAFNPSLNGLNFTIDVSTDQLTGYVPGKGYLPGTTKYNSKIIVTTPFSCLKLDARNMYSGNILINIKVKSTRSDNVVVDDVNLTETAPFNFDPISKKGNFNFDLPLPTQYVRNTNFLVNFYANQDPNPTPTPMQSPCGK